MGTARLAKRPVRVLALCNIAPPADLYAEAYLVGLKSASIHGVLA